MPSDVPRLVLGHQTIVQMVHVVHGHLGDQHSRAQSQHGGQQVLVLTQETTDHGPAEDRAKAKQQSSSGTKDGRDVISNKVLKCHTLIILPVSCPGLCGHILQVRTSVEVQGGSDEGCGQQHIRNVLLGHESVLGMNGQMVCMTVLLPGLLTWPPATGS